MPVYIYKNPKTGEVKEVIQMINEPHIYSCGGVNWDRIFTIPNASVDTKINPLDPKDFVLKTKNKKGNLKEIWEVSAEASQKRERMIGKDPVKEKYYENWSKKRKGRKHPDLIKKEIGEVNIEI